MSMFFNEDEDSFFPATELNHYIWDGNKSEKIRGRIYDFLNKIGLNKEEKIHLTKYYEFYSRMKMLLTAQNVLYNDIPKVTILINEILNNWNEIIIQKIIDKSTTDEIKKLIME